MRPAPLWALRRRTATPAASDRLTRKTVNQTQLGVVYERRVDAANSLQAMVYGGLRGTEQYQSIPEATQQSSPRRPGGVILLGRNFGVRTSTSVEAGVKARLGG